MKCKIRVQLITIITIELLVIQCSAQLDTNPVDKDARILKQPPHHWGTPAPDSGIKLDFIPFKVLASVRREESTKHLPREAALAEASTPEEIILAKRLRESITTKKLGEVYTEQGYEDQKYDHGYHEKHGDFKEKYEKFDKGKVNSKKPTIDFNTNDEDEDHKSSSTNKQESPTYYPRSYPKFKHQSTNNNIKPATNNKQKLHANHNYDKHKYPYYKTAPKNSPQRYATNTDLIPKKGDSEMPFYDSTNYRECPEISPNIKIGPDVEPNKGEPRLKGLGDKIDCLKSKYFGDDPFDNPFFKEETVESIEGIDNLSAMLLPSEANTQPILFIANASKSSQQANKKDQITRPSNNNKKKVYNNEKTVISTPKRQSKTEYIEGMLPPPLPRHRFKREQSRQVYSGRRGGVKFASTDLDGDGSEIDVASIVTSHRVSPDSKYGARDTESRRAPENTNTRPRESRTRSRHYEVTELPEEPVPTSNSRFSNRGSSRRNNNNNNSNNSNNNDNIKVTKEKVYSSTYVPRTNVEDDLSPEVTTNAIVPEVTLRYKLETDVYNTETQPRDIVTEVPFKPEYIAPTTSRAHDSGRSRTRSRTPVAASISEDVFQGRGERRKSEIPAKTNSELLRSRNRNNRVKSVDNNAKQVEITTPEPQISFDSITQEPEAFIIPTESIPIINQAPTESIEIITEKIPTERQSTGRQRNTESSRHPTPSERRQNIERQSRPERRQRVRPEPEISNNQYDNDPTTQRVIQSRDRSASRRYEAFKSKKQDYTANINFEPSRHSRQRSSGSRGSIDPVENVEQVEQLADTRRVNRQGSRRSLESSKVEPQQVEAAPAQTRRTSRRRGPAESAAATAPASSTRYQFPGNQPTTLFQDDAGRRYLCIILEDDLNVDKVVINTKL